MTEVRVKLGESVDIAGQLVEFTHLRRVRQGDAEPVPEAVLNIVEQQPASEPSLAEKRTASRKPKR